MYGPEANRPRQPPREQRLPAISGLAETERHGHLRDTPERREEEYRDVHLVRLQEKYRQDMKEMLANMKEMLAKKDEHLQRKDEQYQEMLAKKDEQQYAQIDRLLAAGSLSSVSAPGGARPLETHQALQVASTRPRQRVPRDHGGQYLC